MDTLHVQERPFFSELRQEFSEICSSFTPAMKAKDVELYQHSLRVQSLALAFTKTVLHLPKAETFTIGLAAFLHDLGKMHISETILHKASGLTHQEFECIQEHPAYGALMFNQFKLLQHIVPSVYHHHERWDGTGYPDATAGEETPFLGRLLAVADAFSAMTTDRSYRKARPTDEALAELRRCSGTDFDPVVVEALAAAVSIAR